jgi:dihydrofolate reductase
MKLSIIVATARNRVIGKNNQLPWHLPQDLKYFREKTIGKPVIMGRKTFESIGRPLPNRVNIVITRNRDWSKDGVIVVHSLVEAIQAANNLPEREDKSELEAMVIGGAEIYKAALEIADRVYLTYIDRDVEGDAWFPVLGCDWNLKGVLPGEKTASESYEYRIYEKEKLAG